MNTEHLVNARCLRKLSAPRLHCSSFSQKIDFRHPENTFSLSLQSSTVPRDSISVSSVQVEALISLCWVQAQAQHISCFLGSHFSSVFTIPHPHLTWDKPMPREICRGTEMVIPVRKRERIRRTIRTIDFIATL